MGMVSSLSAEPGARARSLRAIGTLAVTVALVASACGSTASPSPASAAPVGASQPAGSPATQPSTAAGPVAGSSLNLCVETVGAQDWTPWLSGNEEEFVTRMIGDVLIRVDDKGELIPGVATSWEMSPDLSTWDFKIRDDIPFQGGYGNITADDVRFSFEQYLNPDSNQSISNLLSKALQGDIKNFEVVSPTEFKIHMNPADPVIYLATVLSQAVPGLPIQSKKYFDEKGADANTHPLGSGPYEFVSSTPGVSVVLKAVPNHWRQTSHYETVNINIVPDEAARLSQLQTGQCDLAPLSPALLAEAETAGVKGVEIKDVGTASMVLGGEYYAQPEKNDCAAPWIQCDAPDKAVAIREALSLAIDRQSILDKIFLGHGTLIHAGGFEWPATRPSTVDPTWTLPAYDPTAAKAKLAEGGFPNGFPIDQWIYLDVPGSIEAGQAVAGNWQDIGIQVKQSPVEYRPVVRPTLMDQSTKGHAFMYFNSNYPETVQAIGTANGKSSTFQAYTDPVLDEYYAKMAVEPDRTKREDLARELMTKMREKVVLIPLFTVDSPWGASAKVGAWGPVPGYELPTNIEYIAP